MGTGKCQQQVKKTQSITNLYSKQFKLTGGNMKNIAVILFTLITSQLVNAARTCEDYITDEWPDSRYTIQSISGDNVVTDNKTGLMWKQCSEGLSGADCLTGTASTHTWQQALAISEIINATGFAGFSDWRLPNIEELRSIAAINCINPAINEVAFPSTPSSLFWSSSPVAVDPNDAWRIYFNDGYVDVHFRGNDYRVRLVRSGQ